MSRRRVEPDLSHEAARNIAEREARAGGFFSWVDFSADTWARFSWACALPLSRRGQA